MPPGGCIDVEPLRIALIDAMGVRRQAEPAVSRGHHDHDDPASATT